MNPVLFETLDHNITWIFLQAEVINVEVNYFVQIKQPFSSIFLVSFLDQVVPELIIDELESIVNYGT